MSEEGASAAERGDPVIYKAEGPAKEGVPHTAFPDEQVTEEGATEQEKADMREGPERTEVDPLGPGGPGMSVTPDELR